jgi:hypothetical protein
MHLEVLIDELGERDRAAAAGTDRSSTFRSAFCASERLANPPACGLADPHPSNRYRYANNG